MLLEHGDYHKDACHGTQVRGTAGERERERDMEISMWGAGGCIASFRCLSTVKRDTAVAQLGQPQEVGECGHQRVDVERLVRLVLPRPERRHHVLHLGIPAS